MDKYKGKILLLVLAFTALTLTCQAQSQSADSSSLKCGTWALQFGIASNFTLTSFQGSTIGAKYQLSQNNAIRGGITINGNSSNGPGSFSGSIGDSSAGTVSTSSSVKSANISFTIQYLWYMNPNGPVHLYAGLGPAISYYYNHNYSENPFLNNNGNSSGFWIVEKYNSIRTLWAAGGAAVIGVEWFACRWLSLHADYNELIQYQWGSSSLVRSYSAAANSNYIPVNQSNSGTTKGWTLNSSAVSFGLNVYL